MSVSTQLLSIRQEVCAKAAHEANRLYCRLLGDNSQVAWEDAPEWQKESCRKGVEGVFLGNTPEESHEGWLEVKKSEGWKYGPVKNVEKKEHPCFLPYDQLPPEQRVKDIIFVTVVKTIGNTLT